MIPAEFEYHRAASLEDAIDKLAANDGAKLLAGGHSLLPMMKLRLAAPTLLVDISRVDGLEYVRDDGGDLVVGALTTHAEVAASEAIAPAHGALREAAASIGDVQVRNCGTIGGSLAHADPAADYAAAASALDAAIEVSGPDGDRSIPVADFFEGLLATSLGPAEIVTAVRIPAAAGVSVYEKFEQPASGFAIVGVAASIATDGDDCTAARIAATGVGDRPFRLTDVEQALIGNALDADTIATAAARADEGVDSVRSDLYADEDYRRHLLRVMTRRAVVRAAS